MQIMPSFRRPGHQDRQRPHAPAEPTERRQAGRRPLDLPLRLRLGNDLFPGQSSDLSAGGIGMRLGPQSDAHILDGALSSHERGALELLLGDIRFVARVRIARVQPVCNGIHVGLAIADSMEAERLIRRLEACGVK